MSGKAPRQKGDRFERECVNRLLAFGVPAERVPLSGSAGGSWTNDLVVEVCGVPEKIECKCRKRAWTDLFGWLNESKKPFALFIKADRTDTLVVMTLEQFARLSKGIL